MKKTIVTIMALGSFAMAQSFTLDSKIIKGEDVFSAYDSVIGSTKAEVATATGMSVDRLGYDKCQATVTMSNLYTTTKLADYEFYLVDCISFAIRYDSATSIASTYLPTSSSLTLKVGNDSKGVSGNAVIEYDTTATDGTNGGDIGTITFSFAEGIKLKGTETLTLAMTATGGKLGFTVLKDTTSASDSGVQDFTDGWTPVVRISGKVIPEPTTATLSLLALAGLAARRRRR